MLKKKNTESLAEILPFFKSFTEVKKDPFIEEKEELVLKESIK